MVQKGPCVTGVIKISIPCKSCKASCLVLSADHPLVGSTLLLHSFLGSSLLVNEAICSWSQLYCVSEFNTVPHLSREFF